MKNENKAISAGTVDLDNIFSSLDASSQMESIDPQVYTRMLMQNYDLKNVAYVSLDYTDGEINNLYYLTTYSIDVPKLSSREIDCLYWASHGKTSAEMATIMGISANTVRSYIETARHNLNAVTITQAVAKAIRMDLLPAHPVKK